MKASVGRIVHYVGYGGGGREQECLAALVTQVDLDGLASLTVFPPGGKPIPVSDVAFDADSLDCTWHWPERVE